MPSQAPNKTHRDSSQGAARGRSRRWKFVAWGMLIALVVVVVVLAILWSLGLARKDMRPSDTIIWNWLELLVVPAALGGAAWWLDRDQKKRDEKAATEQKQRELKAQAAQKQREQKFEVAQKRRDQASADERLRVERLIARLRHHQTTLEAYLDFMSSYVADSGDPEALKAIMRARTLLVLDSLQDDDGKQRPNVYAFARETGLLSERKLFSGYKGLRNRNLIEADLEGADLCKCDLSDAKLMRAKLNAADLSGANLTRADLTEAQLEEVKDEDTKVTLKAAAKAHDVILNDAVLINSRLSRVELPRAKMQRANLKGAFMEGVDLTDADLTDAYLEGAKLLGATLNGAVLRGSHIDNETQLEPTWALAWQFVNLPLTDVVLPSVLPNLDSANIQGANVSFLNLTSASLRWANLQNVTAVETILAGVDLSAASCIEANFQRADLSNTKLIGTNLTNADLSWCNLRGAILDDSTQIDSKWRLVWAILNQKSPTTEVEITLGDYDASPTNPWLEWREVKDGRFRGPDLSKVSLEAANLSSANLSHVDMQNAALADTWLNGANLSGARLRGASLLNANLTDAVLDNTDFTLADLTGAIVSRQQLMNALTNGARLDCRYIDGE